MTDLEVDTEETRRVRSDNEELSSSFAEIDAVKVLKTRAIQTLQAQIDRRVLKIGSSNKRLQLKMQEKEVYQKLRCLAQMGRTVYPPILHPQGRKRKRESSTPNEARNKSRRTEFSTELAHSVSGSPAADPTLFDHVPLQRDEDRTQAPLTMASIETCLLELEDSLKVIQAEIRAAEDERYRYEHQQAELKKEKEDVDAEEWQLCESIRDAEVIAMLQADFRTSRKQLEAQRFDPRDTTPITDEPNFDKDLDVYCISAKGYKELTSLSRSKRQTNFRKPDDTGIPGLRRFAFNAAAVRTRKQCEMFNNQLKSLILSFNIWKHGGSNSSSLPAMSTSMLNEHRQPVLQRNALDDLAKVSV